MDNECEFGNSLGYGDFLEEVSFNAASADDSSLIEKKAVKAVRSPKSDNKATIVKESLSCSTKNVIKHATESPLNLTILASEDGSCLSEISFEMNEKDFVSKNDSLINNGNEIINTPMQKKHWANLIEINNHNKLDEEPPVSGKQVNKVRETVVYITPKLIHSITKMEKFDKIIELNFSVKQKNQKIKFIENLDGLCNLEKLVLSHNIIEKIQHLEKLKRLKFLDVSHNKISSLNGLSSLVSLQYLNISNNKVQLMPKKILSNLKNLRVFCANNNCIESLEELCSLNSLINLQEMEMKGNPISSFPHYKDFAIFQLRTLSLLDGSCVSMKQRSSADQCFMQDELYKKEKMIDMLSAKIKAVEQEYDKLLEEKKQLKVNEELLQNNIISLKKTFNEKLDELNTKSQLLESKTNELNIMSSKQYKLEQEIIFYKLDARFQDFCVEKADGSHLNNTGESTYIGNAHFKSPSPPKETVVLSKVQTSRIISLFHKLTQNGINEELLKEINELSEIFQSKQCADTLLVEGELTKCKENNFNNGVECSKQKDILKLNNAEQRISLKIFHEEKALLLSEVETLKMQHSSACFLNKQIVDYINQLTCNIRSTKEQPHPHVLQNPQAQKVLTNLCERFREKDDLIKDLQTHLNKAKVNIGSLEIKLKNLSSDFLNSQETIKQLKEEMDVKESKERVHNHEISILKSQFSREKNDIEAKHLLLLNEYDSVANNMKEQIEDLEEELVDMKSKYQLVYKATDSSLLTGHLYKDHNFKVKKEFCKVNQDLQYAVDELQTLKQDYEDVFETLANHSEKTIDALDKLWHQIQNEVANKQLNNKLLNKITKIKSMVGKLSLQFFSEKIISKFDVLQRKIEINQNEVCSKHHREIPKYHMSEEITKRHFSDEITNERIVNSLANAVHQIGQLQQLLKEKDEELVKSKIIKDNPAGSIAALPSHLFPKNAFQHTNCLETHKQVSNGVCQDSKMNNSINANKCCDTSQHLKLSESVERLDKMLMHEKLKNFMQSHTNLHWQLRKLESKLYPTK